MYVELIVGVLLIASTYLIMRYFKYFFKGSNQFSEKKIIEIVERSKDTLYYFQIEPTMEHLFVSKSIDEYLGEGTQKLLLKYPDYVFQIAHPDDIPIIQAKLLNKLDYGKTFRERFRTQDGQYKWFEEYSTPIYKHGRLVALQGILRNIDEKVYLEEKLQFQISHDTLTKVYNRRFFEEKKKYYNEMASISIGLIICDLDRLKNINDGFGHQEGDKYIVSAAEALKKVFGELGIVARVGGDEFAVILPHINQDTLNEHVDKLQQEVMIQNIGLPHEKSLSLSVGYAWARESKGEMETLYAAADAEMCNNKLKQKDLHLLMK